MTSTTSAADVDPVPAEPGPAAPSRRPPLLAVLVDNHVIGDSRVQKCSIAAAEAGYRVVLIGRAQAAPDTFTIGSGTGQVEVRRIEAPFRMLALTRRVPPGRWWHPLAYPSADHASARSLRLTALGRDLQARKILHRRADGAGVRAKAQRWGLKAQTARLRLARYWHLARAYQLKQMTDRVKASDALAYRAGLKIRTALSGPRAWRSFDPVLLDVELAFGPVLDQLKPDLIHANDFRMSGVAVRAAARAFQAGRRVPVVYDVHEFVPGVIARSARWRAANSGHEAEYITAADRVVTVSDRLAQMLADRYRLGRLPAVVLNAPQFDPAAEPPQGGLRAACGLADGVPLLVYGGSAAPQRGLETAIDALPELPQAHLALVISSERRAKELSARAAELGVSDRLHVLDYVPQEQVVPFLRSATAGIIPIHHLPNHEIALITKYLEYAHAGLPIITSDTETMGGRTRELGNGEVFRAQDTADYVRAVRAVLADPQRYRAAYAQHAATVEGWSWVQQKQVLLGVYAEVLDQAGVRAAFGHRPTA